MILTMMRLRLFLELRLPTLCDLSRSLTDYSRSGCSLNTFKIMSFPVPVLQLHALVEGFCGNTAHYHQIFRQKYINPFLQATDLTLSAIYNFYFSLRSFSYSSNLSDIISTDFLSSSSCLSFLILYISRSMP